MENENRTVIFFQPYNLDQGLNNLFFSDQSTIFVTNCITTCEFAHLLGILEIFPRMKDNFSTIYSCHAVIQEIEKTGFIGNF